MSGIVVRAGGQNVAVSSAHFARSWEEHVESHLSDFAEIVSLLSEAFRFDPRISRELLDDWENRTLATLPTTDSDIDSVVSVAAFGRRIFACDAASRLALAKSAAKRQFAMLLEAALVAAWAAEIDVESDAVARLLGLATRIAAAAAPFESGRELAEAALEWLRDEPWTARAYTAEFRAQLEERMTALAATSAEEA